MDTDVKFSQLIQEQISDLKQRNLVEFLDLNDIFKKYTVGTVSPNLIKTLVALEVHLKNGKQLPSSLEEIC